MYRRTAGQGAAAHIGDSDGAGRHKSLVFAVAMVGISITVGGSITIKPSLLVDKEADALVSGTIQTADLLAFVTPLHGITHTTTQERQVMARAPYGIFRPYAA